MSAGGGWNALSPPVPTIAPLRAAPGPAKRWRRNLTFDKISLFVVFLGLPLALYITFVVSPLIQAVSYSFTDWSGFTADFKPVGLANYVKILSDDTDRKSTRL